MGDRATPVAQLVTRYLTVAHIPQLAAMSLKMCGRPSVSQVNAMVATMPHVTSLTLDKVNCVPHTLDPLIGFTRLTELNMAHCRELTAIVLHPLVRMKSLAQIRIYLMCIIICLSARMSLNFSTLSSRHESRSVFMRLWRVSNKHL